MNPLQPLYCVSAVEPRGEHFWVTASSVDYVGGGSTSLLLRTPPPIGTYVTLEATDGELRFEIQDVERAF